MDCHPRFCTLPQKIEEENFPFFIFSVLFPGPSKWGNYFWLEPKVFVRKKEEG
jgi:hypothetical protein